MKNNDSDQPKPNAAFTRLIEDMGGNQAAIGKKLRNEDGKPVSGQLIGQYMAGRQKPKIWFFRTWKETYGKDISHLFDETDSEANVSRETVNEPIATYELLQRKNDSLAESVRHLTVTIEKHAQADLIRAENERQREKNIERLIGLLESQVNYGKRETAPVPPAAPGINAEDAAKPENLLGNKKKSGRQ